jgi:integrase
MAYSNPKNKNRLIIIEKLEDAFSLISTEPNDRHVVSVDLAGVATKLYLSPEALTRVEDRSVYNMPFLFDENGLPWHEANSYLLSLVENTLKEKRPTDEIRRRASRLLDYKIFCEENKIDWLNFNGKRKIYRPTYRYFRHLIDSDKVSQVINQYTGTVYDFYSYISKRWHPIDLDRVDTVEKNKLLVKASRGHILLDIQKRSQTKPVPSASHAPLGFVRDEGEDLRPLTGSELNELLEIIKSENWNQQERLIIGVALATGARKQSVLTLRLKHLDLMKKNGIRKTGDYKLYAGPGTSVDTKYNKKQVLYFPKDLVDKLKIYAQSKVSRERREKFMVLYKSRYPNLDLPVKDDQYLFLSEQGNCFYMARDDLRYPYVRSCPIGQVTDNITKKIIKSSSDKFPKDFAFHWLRATFGLQYYQSLLPLVEAGKITAHDAMLMVQIRMHHENQETTEHYLKLFSGLEEKVLAQTAYESILFEAMSFYE